RIVRGTPAVLAGVVSWGVAGGVAGLLLWFTGLTVWGPGEGVFSGTLRFSTTPVLNSFTDWRTWALTWAVIGAIFGAAGALFARRRAARRARDDPPPYHHRRGRTGEEEESLSGRTP